MKKNYMRPAAEVINLHLESPILDASPAGGLGTNENTPEVDNPNNNFSGSSDGWSSEAWSENE